MPQRPSTAARTFRICSLIARFAVFVALFLPARVQAVIFYSTADPNYNTTAPTGTLASSGWQWVGVWGAFQGTVIGPHHFLAVQHVGGTVGDPFVYNGVSYQTIAFTDDFSTDLRIVEVSGGFPSWAPLYTHNDESGKALVVFGRGYGRGADVRVANGLKGWEWGGTLGTLRWGQNTVVEVVNLGTGWGDHLYALFTGAGGANECHLASGDSSGPVFIDDGSGYKLAGVAHAVDGPFNTTTTGDGFNAALFDARGLYAANSSQGWTYVTGASPVPSGFYATRVSVRADWIDSVVFPPDKEPLLSGPQAAILLGLLAGLGAVLLSRPVVPPPPC